LVTLIITKEIQVMSTENPGTVHTPTYGIELEKTFAAVAGDPHAVGEAYFQELLASKESRGGTPHIKRIGDMAVGVTTPYGEEALDNSFGLGESATGPISEEAGGLNELSRIVDEELRDVAGALATEEAVVINMSNHPLTELSPEVYQRIVVPKPIYNYLREVRGWNHMAGINGKSQNSPSVGVEAEQAAGAVNSMIGLGSGLIALYANSPFEQGRVTGVQENRLALWNDMFSSARVASDRRLHQPPEKPFNNLRDYFEWMFAPDTSMFFVTGEESGGSEKLASRMIAVEGNPSLLEFMRNASWRGQVLNTDEVVEVEPSMSDFTMHQFLQFTGARIRYGLKDEAFPVSDFVMAMGQQGDEVDRLFAEKGAYFYIEGRDPGANFPDRELYNVAGDEIARSVVMSPAAIQTGIIRNVAQAGRLMDAYGWDTLMGLRDQAVIDGLRAQYNGQSVAKLCHELLEVAAAGLRTDEQWMLAYPEFVLRSNANGADRALASFERASGNTVERIKKVTRERSLVMPTDPGIKA
jgi:gamma-glutamylcysteine synthetase